MCLLTHYSISEVETTITLDCEKEDTASESPLLDTIDAPRLFHCGFFARGWTGFNGKTLLNALDAQPSI